MKASEFVKKFGWEKAKECLEFGRNYTDLEIRAKHNDLKRLVESYELVESMGGYELAKKELQRQSILRWINPETERLREAIADMDSCT